MCTIWYSLVQFGTVWYGFGTVWYGFVLITAAAPAVFPLVLPDNKVVGRTRTVPLHPRGEPWTLCGGLSPLISRRVLSYSLVHFGYSLVQFGTVWYGLVRFGGTVWKIMKLVHTSRWSSPFYHKVKNKPSGGKFIRPTVSTMAMARSPNSCSLYSNLFKNVSYELEKSPPNRTKPYRGEGWGGARPRRAVCRILHRTFSMLIDL